MIIAFAASPEAHAEVSPAIVGWGNLFVPGLGATFRGDSTRGMMEAGTEVGLYYGGTFGVREGNFSIDGSVNVPTAGHLFRPTVGQTLQEFGLKLHFYDTFYNYQQAARAMALTDREKDNPQPLYQGDWKDMLSAPFKWENLSSPWVFPLILISSTYLIYSYRTTAISPINYRAKPYEETFYGVNQIGAIPFGGALGEEALFRGFIQREARLYTQSAAASLLVESSLFTLIHPNALKPSAFASGIYFGIMTNHFDGNLEPAIAAHFWVNVVDGLVSYWLIRRAQGKDTPFAPQLTANIPF